MVDILRLSQYSTIFWIIASDDSRCARLWNNQHVDAGSGGQGGLSSGSGSGVHQLAPAPTEVTTLTGLSTWSALDLDEKPDYNAENQALRRLLRAAQIRIVN